MAVVFDAFATVTGGSTTWTHTPVGTPTAVGVWISCFNGATGTITGVTYGGVSMAREIFAPSGGPFSLATGCYLYSLPNPPSGAQTVVVSGTPSFLVGASVTVTGSDTTTCFRNVGNSTSGSATGPLTVTLTTVSGDLVVDMFDAFGGNTLTPAQTLAWGPVNNSNVIDSGSYQAAITTTTINSWTCLGATNGLQLLAGAFKGTSGGGDVLMPQIWL